MKLINAACDILVNDKDEYDNHLKALLSPLEASIFHIVIRTYGNGWTYTSQNYTDNSTNGSGYF